MDNILAAKQILENYDARVPKDNDRVYKDECIYSFDSPVSIEFCTYNINLILYSVYIDNKINVYFLTKITLTSMRKNYLIP
jgi:hypothetical protein